MMVGCCFSWVLILLGVATGLFGRFGIGFGDSWFTGFVLSAKWSGYGWVIVVGFVIRGLGLAYMERDVVGW